MKLSQFRFDLPLSLIAQTPNKRREDSRMMVIDRKTGNMSDHHFHEIMNFFALAVSMGLSPGWLPKSSTTPQVVEEPSSFCGMAPKLNTVCCWINLAKRLYPNTSSVNPTKPIVSAIKPFMQNSKVL